jgi:hypothetical protein
MRSWFALVALFGCNQVLGIGPSVLADAQQYDSPLDAPYACPSAGTSPRFARNLHQVTTTNCNDYTFSAEANRSTGWCLDPTGTTVGIWEGTYDMDDMHPAVGFDTPGIDVYDPRLTPEGDQLYVKVIQGVNTRIVVYQRDPGGWMPDHNVAALVSNADQVASVSRGPTRRLFIIRNYSLREVEVDATGASTELAPYTEVSFGLTSIFNPRVTADGLRLVVSGTSSSIPRMALYVASRPDLASRFGPATVIENIPSTTASASLSTDCSRLYFSGLESVFYVQQQ